MIDSTIGSAALPTIARALDTSPASAIWATNAYQLAVTVSLLPLAALGEIIGYRRVYLGGLVLFTIASLGCAMAGSFEGLVAGRAIQGFGAAGLMSVNSAIIRFIQPRARLARGLGLNAMIVSSAAAAGPTVAGLILGVADWPWIFAVNVPIGLGALLIGWRALPESPRGRQRFDIVSALLSASTFGLLILGLDALAHGGGLWAALPQVLAGLAAGALLVRRQVGVAKPLLPVDLLRIPVFTLSVCTSVCSFMAQGLAFSALPFLLQSGYGFSVFTAGLLTTPWFLATAIAAPLSGRLMERVPAAVLGGVGLAMMSAGLGLLAVLPPSPDVADIVWRMVLGGFGFGLFQTPNNRTMVGAAPPERAGGASGMLSTARLLGQTTGAALVGLVLGWMPGMPVGAPKLALAIGCGMAALGALVSLLRLRARASG
ncbi:DHA2 family multidrug resistance protein-like MFS transporter [Roseomonas pecuniae]|uniref:DHA2 family multidrug resistance protein-like MFS transporter n=1 Tax=Muricoccus pecuniae TaxID=693023 RepID=A0A840YDW8_9PROT|nr:DHA2 family multidrug resistance protein-like MFS transporter [Roseomonas pecuniae]